MYRKYTDNFYSVEMTGLSVEESADERAQTQCVALEDEEEKVDENDGVDLDDFRRRGSHWLRKTV